MIKMNTQYNIKDIVSNNNIAKISHVIAGVIYYEVNTHTGSKFMFPVDMNNKDDVGTATFPAEIKAITLMRYIRKSIEADSIVQLK